MNARSLPVLAVLSIACGSATVPTPELGTSVGPLVRVEPTASAVPPCPEPRYRLHLDRGPRTIEGVDGAPALDHDKVVPVFEGDLDGDGIDDVIIDLGLCGNWGDCIHVVLRGCDEPQLFSLASDPHHYAHGFAVEPSGEGPPAMWELVRGEMDRAHEITRVRWEIREGRAAPSSAWEGADACMPAVRDAVFIPSGTQVELTVFGSGFCPRAVPLIAWVGDQAVSRIVLGSDGGRFSGMLVDPPNDGDRVRVGWADGELHDTEIVFRSKVTDP
jgi:hypothetical protein